MTFASQYDKPYRPHALGNWEFANKVSAASKRRRGVGRRPVVIRLRKCCSHCNVSNAIERVPRRTPGLQPVVRQGKPQTAAPSQSSMSVGTSLMGARRSHQPLWASQRFGSRAQLAGRSAAQPSEGPHPQQWVTRRVQFDGSPLDAALRSLCSGKCTSCLLATADAPCVRSWSPYFAGHPDRLPAHIHCDPEDRAGGRLQ